MIGQRSSIAAVVDIVDRRGLVCNSYTTKELKNKIVSGV